VTAPLTREDRIRWMLDDEINVAIKRLFAMREKDKADRAMIDRELSALAAERVARRVRRKVQP
jgi:hypothetical protein